jgi:hypothetical protein
MTPRAIGYSMDQNTSALERAFQLASLGNCSSTDDIRKRLKEEGYSADQVTGGCISKQLKALMTDARRALAARAVSASRNSRTTSI